MPPGAVQTQRVSREISLEELSRRVDDFGARISDWKGKEISKAEAHNEIGEFRDLLSLCYCYQSKLKWRSDDGFGQALGSLCGDFVATFSEFALRDAAAGQNLNVERLLDQIQGMGQSRPTTAAELIVAVHETRGIGGSLAALTDQGFLERLGGLNELNASSLLYVVSITKNFTDLTDNRLLSGESLRFLNSLGMEPASMWLYGIARSNGLDALVSGSAIGTEMLSLINRSPNLAVWLSYAMGLGVGGIDGPFIGELSRLDAQTAERRLIGHLLDRAHLLDAARKSDIGGGKSVLLVDLGDGHNFELVLKAIEIKQSGFNVTLLSGVTDHLEIARVAAERKVHAIGYGLVADVYTQMVGNMSVVVEAQKAVVQAEPYYDLR